MSRLKSLLTTLPILTIPEPPQLLEEFTLFPNLAPEIREMIWILAALSPRKVNLLSMLFEPEPRLKSTIEGQNRQPAMMGVNMESRTVGKSIYERIYSVPRWRCKTWRGVEEEKTCPPCSFAAWNAISRWSSESSWTDDQIKLLPTRIKKLLRRVTYGVWRDGLWIVPPHEPVYDGKGDLHWVNFETDEFVLKLPNLSLGLCDKPDLRYRFNFGLHVVQRIRRFAACTVPDMARMDSLRWVLNGMLQWPQLQMVRIGVHGEKGYDIRTGPLPFGEVDLELRKSSVYPVLKSYLGKGMPKAIRAKICLEETETCW